MPGHQLRHAAMGPNLCRVLQQCNRIQCGRLCLLWFRERVLHRIAIHCPVLERRGFGGDFNGDGYVDVVLTSYRNAGSYIQNSIIYYGSSAGLDSVGTEVMATAGAL